MNTYRLIYEDSKKFTLTVDANDEFEAEKLANKLVVDGVRGDTLGQTITLLNTSKVEREQSNSEHSIHLF